MAGHSYYQHLADNGTLSLMTADRDDGVHLLAADPEVVAWLAAGNTLLPPKVDLPAYAAAARYAKETAGITVGTTAIATDRGSQSLITGMWAAAQITPTISVAFKSASGFVVINAQQVEKIATAVAAHVQASFTTEAQIGVAIAAGTITTTKQIDDAFAAVTA